MYSVQLCTGPYEDMKILGSSLDVPGVPWHTEILADQLTLFQPGGTDYAHLITTGTSGFSDLPTALSSTTYQFCLYLPICVIQSID